MGLDLSDQSGESSLHGQLARIPRPDSRDEGVGKGLGDPPAESMLEVVPHGLLLGAQTFERLHEESNFGPETQERRAQNLLGFGRECRGLTSVQQETVTALGVQRTQPEQLHELIHSGLVVEEPVGPPLDHRPIDPFAANKSTKLGRSFAEKEPRIFVPEAREGEPGNAGANDRSVHHELQYRLLEMGCLEPLKKSLKLLSRRLGSGRKERPWHSLELTDPDRLTNDYE
jgi:hypothetical protein